MSTISIVTSFNVDLDRRSGVIHKSPSISKMATLYFAYMSSALRISFNSRKSIKEIRATQADCTTGCSENGCSEDFIGEVKATRNKMLELNSLVQKSVLPLFVKNYFNDSVIDWDDLVEDCTISSDPKIRASIQSIASLL